MQYQQLVQVGLLQKLIVVIFLSLLVSGEKEEAMVFGTNSHSKTVPAEKQQQKQQRPRLRHSFDSFFSSKRRVPNASDPLHNR
ncbi:Clavata3/ESR (CLE) [Melia azedarach]|uniref:Clavata3/ESR (CLE) n=1 Tax=Melia azedarach TaxID=155640 RepID=A0ACC1WTE9_MELAZ|nr:Clavata3/ESR (CLE) [Melia azedarach]